MQRISFLCMEVGFGRTDSTPHRGTCSVGAELLEYVQRQDSGPTETFSEAPEAYGCCCGRQGCFCRPITGWGATYNRQAVSGVWTGPQLQWLISCLELLAVRLALNRLKGRLRDKHVLVRMDNTATVAYIN